MDLEAPPDPLACTECGEAITERGYLPATERDGTTELHPDDALCDDCGFNAVGMTGCAPALDDVIDPGPDDVLLYVQVTDDGLDVISTKD